jgi:hypothetical protein
MSPVRRSSVAWVDRAARARAARLRPFSVLSAAALVSSGLSVGCRDILSTDEFETSQRFAPCGAVEVRTPAGCVAVGVAACGFGFHSDGRGSCEPNFAIEPCDEGTYVRPGLPSCSALTSSCATLNQFGSVSAAVGTTVYVSSEAGVAPEGKPWFATIEDALAKQAGDLTIMLSQGMHLAHVEIRNRRVRMLGVIARASKNSRSADPVQVSS